MILKTTRTEPGFNIYISRKNAQIDVVATFIETGHPDRVLAVIDGKKFPGRTFGGYDYDTGGRIEEAYAKCGKDLGKFVAEKGFKKK